MLYKLANIVFRGATIGLRFSLVFIIGKYLSLDFLGEYSIWNTTITLTVLFIGLDFYIYSNRELISNEKDKQALILFNNLIFIFLSYTLLIPLSLLIFSFEVLDKSHIILFYIVLINEHIGMEFYRLFNAIKKPLLGNIIQFIRNSLWVIFVLGHWYSNDFEFFNIKDILISWSMFAILSNVLSTFIVIRFYRPIKNVHVKWEWIKNGAKTSLKLITTTLALKTIEFSDRYLIDIYLGKTELGIYTFHYQLSNLINVIIFTMIIVYQFPLLTKKVLENDSNYIMMKKNVNKSIFKYWFGISLLLIASYPFIIDFMKNENLQNTTLYATLIITTLFTNLYINSKIILNAAKKDLNLLLITTIAAIINVMINLLLIESIGILSAAISSITSYIFLVIGSNIFENKFKNTLFAK